MSWPFTSRVSSLTATELISERSSRFGRNVRVNRDQALAHSAVWACLRLRADLISTMPVDVFRRVQGVQVEQTKPAVLLTPGGPNCDWNEWAYSTEFDLDSVGNTVGIILARDGFGLPSLIEPVDIDTVTFIGRGATITKVRIGTTEYDYGNIWHEKQFTKSGCPVGLSPIAYAALSINNYLSAQQFAADWFGNSSAPGGHLKNTARVLKKGEALKVKENFKATVQSGDIWVSGNDWEYSMLSAKASESSFLESMKFSVTDVCRYFGVPGDMIDASPDGSSVTYANITQRNLQLLIMNIGPAIVRRENTWSRRLVPTQRYVKLNTGALLRMDLKSRYEAAKMGIDGRFLAPSEAREYENLPPFTPDQLAEFAALFPAKAPMPTQGVTS